MHRLGLVLCILHVDLTLEPASYVSSITSISEAGGLRASSLNLFSKRFSDAGIMSATILLTALGEAGAFPPPVFLLIKFLFRLDFQALPMHLYCFQVALVPIWISGVEGFSQFFPQDVFFLFKLALSYALFSILFSQLGKKKIFFLAKIAISRFGSHFIIWSFRFSDIVKIILAPVLEKQSQVCENHV